VSEQLFRKSLAHQWAVERLLTEECPISLPSQLSCIVATDMHPISSFAEDPSKAGQELQPCLDKAKDAVPKHQHKTTPIFLGATAGMRILRYVC